MHVRGLQHLGALDRDAMLGAHPRGVRGADGAGAGKVERPVRLLSGGQRQGCGHRARGDMGAHSVVLLDEPTAALGVRQRAAVDELIHRLRSRDFGVPLISHDVPQVLEPG